MAHRGRGLLILAFAALLVGVTAAAAETGQTAGRDVQARLTWKQGYRDIELTIVRKGQRFTRQIGDTYFGRLPKARVRDLDADGEPEVWVDTYTGGAHCCFETRFFRWAQALETYVRAFHSWGNVNYRAKNLDGRRHVELVTFDDRFAYVFSAFADSLFPVRIWHFDDGRLRNVTRLFPRRVERDARWLWGMYLERRRKADVRGILAAWQADQYLLGRQEAGWRTLELALKRGDLDWPDGIWPTGVAYLKKLRAFLAQTGYARASRTPQASPPREHEGDEPRQLERGHLAQTRYRDCPSDMS